MPVLAQRTLFHISSLELLTCVSLLLQITYSVPYALVSTRIEALGLGQGLLGCSFDFIGTVDVVLYNSPILVQGCPWEF